MDVPPPPLQHLPSPVLQNDAAPSNAVELASDDSNPTVEIPPKSTSTCNGRKSPIIVKKKVNMMMKKKKNKPPIDVSDPPQPSSSSSSTSCCTSTHSVKHKRLRVSSNCRNPRILIGSAGQKKSDVEALALPIGMSIAAVVAQVLERNSSAGERMAVDHLSLICTSAVRESLANVFGDRFDCFARNFEKSFRSTLMTLRLINESSQSNGRERLRHLSKASCLDLTPPTSFNREGDSTLNSAAKDSHSEATMSTLEENEGNMQMGLMKNNELALHGGQIYQQLVCASPNRQHSVINPSMLCTLEKSVTEQVRSNDLKTFEMGLIMQKLQLKETQLGLNSDSNHLERYKLSMGISKASFKAEKFKNELEDTRHAELLKKCIDCLVAGLLIMLAFLAYGAYVYSHQRITEVTASCTPTTKESKSWWMPNPMASFNSGLQVLTCQVQVVSRMLFGVLMILAITYLLLQRSATPKQTMPVTFILLLLGVACGFAGKFCIDTLGGSGYHWLLYWEALCSMHFFSNVCTPSLFIILHGRITVSERSKESTIFPYWIRRFLFYATMLLFLPLLCGFIPFAGPGEWKDHFSSLVMDLLPIWVD